jgi:hypothetical protein
MEILNSIQQWIYPIMSLILFILSAVSLRYNGSLFFIAAFGLNFLNSIFWKLLPFVIDHFKLSTVEAYKYSGFLSFAIYLLSSLFFIIGIVLLGKIKPEKHFSVM